MERLHFILRRIAKRIVYGDKLKEFDKPIRKILRRCEIEMPEIYGAICKLGAVNIPKFVDSYRRKAVKLIKKANFDAYSDDGVILLCAAVKDDLVRVKSQLEYHRNLGIKHFVYVDNDSNDGTFEFLQKQEDVTLFICNEIFNPDCKASWGKQAADMLGYNRWYLFLDSDELFSYPGIEEIPIDKYVEFLEHKKMQSAFMLCVDMYSKEPVYTATSDNFLRKLCFFDTDSYDVTTKHSINGGPRGRVVGVTHRVSVNRLVKAQKHQIFLPHYYLPKPIQKQKAPIAFLLHYKFLKCDIELYYDEKRLEGHWAGGKLYKAYREAYDNDQNMSFYYEGSQKLNSSMDLLKIDICDVQFFKELFHFCGV